MSTLYHIPNKIVIHCSDTPNGQQVDIEKIREHHLSQGYSDIGYHLIIQPDGECVNGRPLNQVGSHVKGHNTGAIGICLIGTDKYTQKQFDVLRYKMDSLFLTFNIKKTDIFTHAQFDTAIAQGKTCPNIRINDIILWYHNVVGEQAIAPYLYKER